MGSVRLYNNKKESQSVGLTCEANEQTAIRRIAMEMPRQMEALWCRAFQCVLKLGNCFMGYRMPEYLEGPGRIRELGAFLKEKGINDVLVVTGSGMVRRGQV